MTDMMEVMDMVDMVDQSEDMMLLFISSIDHFVISTYTNDFCFYAEPSINSFITRIAVDRVKP